VAPFLSLTFSLSGFFFSGIRTFLPILRKIFPTGALGYKKQRFCRKILPFGDKYIYFFGGEMMYIYGMGGRLWIILK